MCPQQRRTLHRVRRLRSITWNCYVRDFKTTSAISKPLLRVPGFNLFIALGNLEQVCVNGAGGNRSDFTGGIHQRTWCAAGLCVGLIILGCVVLLLFLAEEAA